MRILPTPSSGSPIAPRKSGQGGPIVDINAPGEAVDLQDHIRPGKTNIVCFWATWCPWSIKAQPKLQRLCAERPEFVCLRVDIRDFQSPAARQHDIKAVPSYAIYDGDGQLLAGGEEARARVKELFEQTGGASQSSHPAHTLAETSR